MKITSITQQVKRSNRYSVFVDEKYSFSLSETALLDSTIASGQELTSEQLAAYKQLSSDDKLYNQALRYAAMRMRSRWEIEFYLERKQAPPSLSETILNKLSNLGFIDDSKYAQSFVHDRRLLRLASQRKLKLELQKKRIPSTIIDDILTSSASGDIAALTQLVERKRRQPKYQDDIKLMQYLARQGFSYSDIKHVLAVNNEA